MLYIKITEFDILSFVTLLNLYQRNLQLYVWTGVWLTGGLLYIYYIKLTIYFPKGGVQN